jgi:pimeloyl-ACP methyl ester carboxylesterase
MAGTPVNRPTVLLLPGLLCDEAAWADAGRSLADAECIVPDYGELDSIPAMAGYVLDLVPQERLCVAGHSMGGRVALEMARLAPERIDRLALLDTGFQPRADGAAGEAEAQERGALVRLAQERGMRAMGRTWARGMVHPAHVDAPVFHAILAMIERCTPEVFAAQVRALLARPDQRDVLLALRCPVVFACGREDAWSPLARHRAMHALVPQSELAVIEDAGHMAPMEQPLAVAGVLRHWVYG